MQHIYDVIKTPADVPITSAAVLVKNQDGSNASLFSNKAGTTPKANPVAVSSLGQFDFYAANGTYSLQVTAPGYAPAALADLVLYDPEDVPPIVVDNELRADLASAAAAGVGAGIPAFAGALSYPEGSLGARLNDAGCSPRSLGAVGDGVADDTAYIQACLTYSRTLDLRNRSWRITDTITLPPGCCVDMRGAYINADTGSNPIFKASGNCEGVQIKGGIVRGTAGAFLECEGTSATPSGMSNYVRHVVLEGIVIRPTSIALFLDLQNAVRYVHIESCYVFTASGINASGKMPEIFIENSFIYSSSGAAGTYGIKTRNAAGGAYYCEGWTIVNSTFDGFEVAFDITDMWVFQVSNCYIGTSGSGGDRYCGIFRYPTTTHCQDIKFSNCVFQGRVKFEPLSSGKDFSATFNGCSSTSLSGGVAIEIANNASGISVYGHKFTNGPGTVAVRAISNNNDIVVDGVDIDSTYSGGVHIQGTGSGTRCEVRNVKYAGTGEGVIALKPIRMSNVPIATAYAIGLKRSFNPATLSGSYAVGAAIASLALNFVQGETGWIVVELSCTGMSSTAGAQRLDIAVPAGMVLPSGTSWGAQFLYPEEPTGKISVRIPYYCTSDVSAGTLSITNATGNTLAVDSHSYFGIVRDM
jgi:hypothetical protein